MNEFSFILLVSLVCNNTAKEMKFYEVKVCKIKLTLIDTNTIVFLEPNNESRNSRTIITRDFSDFNASYTT